jgi:hypothetical protein
MAHIKMHTSNLKEAFRDEDTQINKFINELYQAKGLYEKCKTSAKLSHYLFTHHRDSYTYEPLKFTLSNSTSTDNHFIYTIHFMKEFEQEVLLAIKPLEPLNFTHELLDELIADTLFDKIRQVLGCIHWVNHLEFKAHKYTFDFSKIRTYGVWLAAKKLIQQEEFSQASDLLFSIEDLKINAEVEKTYIRAKILSNAEASFILKPYTQFKFIKEYYLKIQKKPQENIQHYTLRSDILIRGEDILL